MKILISEFYGRKKEGKAGKWEKGIFIEIINMHLFLFSSIPILRPLPYHVQSSGTSEGYMV